MGLNRSRTSKKTEHESVQIYEFTDQENIDGTSKDDPLVIEYNILKKKSQQPPEKRDTTENDIERIRELQKYFRDIVDKHITNQQKSVLDGSINETVKPWNQGQDSQIFEHDQSNYVTKYSHIAHEPSPETILYLRNKYTLLKKFLGPNIPKSAFFLGERRKGFKKEFPEQALDPEIRAITLQRKVDGKTFKDMTKEERERPEVMYALKKAHKKYITAKRILKDTSFLLDLKPNTIDIKLDIGSLSKEADSDSIDEKLVRSFSSPNIMWDENKKQIYFIDFGMGKWNKDQQIIFNQIVNK